MQNVEIFRKKDVDMKLRKRPETETRRERDRRRNPRRTEVSSYTILPKIKRPLSNIIDT